MESTHLNYRQKWRLKRRQKLIRQVPLIAGAALVVVVVVAFSVRERKPQLGAVAWAHGDGTRGLPRLAVGRDRLIIAWERGTVTAHSPDTGEAVWSDAFQRSQGFVAPPAVGEDCVVFGAMDGFVKCLELATGEVRWGYDANALIRSTPVIVGDRVYVGTDDGRVVSLSIVDGVDAWIYPDADRTGLGPITGGPAISGDTLACGATDRTIFGLDVSTGKERWRRRIDAPVMARVTTANGLAYFAGETGVVECVQVADGETVWKKRVPGLIRVPVLASASTVYVATSERLLFCFDAQSGDVVWNNTLRGRPTTSIVATTERVYLGTSDGMIQAFSHASGKTVWRWRPGSKPLGDLLLSGDRVFCGTNSGRAFSVRVRGAD
jgi:serine/threonine-protein kinase